MFEHLVHALRHAIVRALIAFILAGMLAAAYGTGLVWLAVRAGSMQPIWLLVGSLGAVAGLASAGFVLVWRLAPAVAALRGLEYLADQAPEAAEQAAHQALPVPEADTLALELPNAPSTVTGDRTADVAPVA
jgi:hypothetical protein